MPTPSTPLIRVLFRAATSLLVLLSLAAADPVRLRIVVWDGDDGLPILRNVIKGFEAAHPGIRVKLENVDSAHFFQKLLTEYAGNVAPDVAMMDPGDFQMFARRKALLSLNPFIAATPGFNIKDYYDQIVKAHTFNGQLYVLPRDIAPMGIIYYNKRMFDEAHIPYPDGSWTWDFKERPELKEKDFFWVMDQLTMRGADGKVTRWGYVPGWPAILADMLVFSQGLQYVDNTESPTKLYYNDPRIIKTYQYVQDIYMKKQWLPTLNDLTFGVQSTGAQLFIDQKAAMYQCGIWDASKVRAALIPGSKEYFNWDIALAPGYKDGHKACGSAGSGYGIMSSTPHPKEAWELVRWMAGPPGMIALAKAGFAQPAIRKIALSSAWAVGPDTPLSQRDPPSRVLTDKAVDYAVFAVTADYWPEIAGSTGLLVPSMDKIWLGSTTAASALIPGDAIAQQRLDTILRLRKSPNYNWYAGGMIGGGLLLSLFAWIYLPERRRKLSAQAKIENRAGYWFAMPGLIGILMFSLGPMLLSLLISFSDWDIIQAAKWRGLGNYDDAFFHDVRFWKSLEVTGLYTLFAVPAGIAIALALALLLNLKIRGMAIFRTCFYLPALASAVASSLIWKKVFQPDGGLLDALIYGRDGHGNFLGIASLLTRITGKTEPANWLGNDHLALPAMAIMSLWAVGGGMIILLAGLQGVPQFYYEAATIDGANAWRRFRAVTLPMIAPSLFFVSITGVIGSFQVFTQAFVLTSGGPNDSTRFYMFHLYDMAFGNMRMGYASALAWVLFLIILILTMLQFKWNRKIYYEADLR